MKISFSPAKWGMMMGNQGLKEMLKVRAELVLILYAYAKVFATSFKSSKGEFVLSIEYYKSQNPMKKNYYF